LSGDDAGVQRVRFFDIAPALTFEFELSGDFLNLFPTPGWPENLRLREPVLMRVQDFFGSALTVQMLTITRYILIRDSGGTTMITLVGVARLKNTHGPAVWTWKTGVS